MSAIQTASGKIGAVERGSGKTPILFLHGVGSDKSVWAPQLAFFGDDRRSVALDYPGYGESDPAREGTGRDDYAAAVLAAMDSFGIDRAHVCGLSLGGVVAIAMHALAPARCVSLIIADSFAVHPEGQAIYDRSIAASTDLRSLAEARVDLLLAAGASPEIRSEVVETMARIDPAAYRLGAEAVWLADQRDRAAAIDVPTLVLCGEEDRVTPPQLSRELAALVPGSKLETIAGAGHLANLERAAAFNSKVASFIAEVEG